MSQFANNNLTNFSNINWISYNVVSSKPQFDSKDAIEQYTRLIQLTKIVNPDRIIREKLPVLNIFSKFFEDKDIDCIDNYMSFIEFLTKIPVNYRKKYKKDLDIQDILNLKDAFKVKKISIRTINKYLEVCSTFLNFCVDQNLIKKNLLFGKKYRLSDDRQEYDHRETFTEVDLNNIFSNEECYKKIINKKTFRNIHFWGCLIGLYSGMRINEISQLHVNDIKLVDDIWCFIVEASSGMNHQDLDFKHLKNKSSKRIIPIHQQVIDLGFLNFVEEQRNKEKVRLFSEITYKKRGSLGYHLSGWFAKMKTKMFKIKSDKKTFHSFRHTFADTLKQKCVPVEITARLLGHEIRGETYSRYGSQYSAESLKKFGIDQIHYNIDWSFFENQSNNIWIKLSEKK